MIQFLGEFMGHEAIKVIKGQHAPYVDDLKYQIQLHTDALLLGKVNKPQDEMRFPHWQPNFNNKKQCDQLMVLIEADAKDEEDTKNKVKDWFQNDKEGN
jgi:hypothetical protein